MAFLRDRLLEGQAEMFDAVSADATLTPDSLFGRDAYVIEQATSAWVQRTFVDMADYRPLKWERVRDGEVIESRETPVFEIVSGRLR